MLQANYLVVHAGPYDRCACESSGEDPGYITTELASLDDTDIGEDIREILSDRYGYSAQYDAGEGTYSNDVANTTNLQRSWAGFCEPLKTQSRFFNSEARSMLDEIFTNLHEMNAGKACPVIRPFGTTRPMRFFRGRVATDLSTLEHILADPVRELAAPPHKFARAGPDERTRYFPLLWRARLRNLPRGVAPP